MEFITSIAVHSGNSELQDRVKVLSFPHRLVLAIADGAGGISGGAQAADFFLGAVQESAASLSSSENCARLLATIDRQMAQSSDCGESTGVIAVVELNRIFGASVGDSMAWSFSAGRRIELTSGQHRKPFLGSDGATAHTFDLLNGPGALVVGTDGLWKYTSIESIEKQVSEGDAGTLANRLCDLVRLRSGAFPDDVAVVTCRISS
jgi:serine/threonine protein phosphatase PrpC